MLQGTKRKELQRICKDIASRRDKDVTTTFQVLRPPRPSKDLDILQVQDSLIMNDEQKLTEKFRTQFAAPDEPLPLKLYEHVKDYLQFEIHLAPPGVPQAELCHLSCPSEGTSTTGASTLSCRPNCRTISKSHPDCAQKKIRRPEQVDI